ncbi:MAG: hypothetical protein RIC56_01515 [Pseudomonadales bacterium]
MRDAVPISIAILTTLVCILIVTPEAADLLRSPSAGSQLSKGFAILNGRHPFVEIDSSVYGPAIFYLSALAQSVTPESPAGELILIICGYGVAYALMFWTLRARVPNPVLLGLFVLACLLTLPAFHKYHVVLAPAIFLACLQMASRRHSAVATGAWLGAGSALAGLFRLDFGAYCVIASLAFLIASRNVDDRKPLGSSVAALFAVGALIAGPWALYLLIAVGPLESMSRFAETTAGVYTGLAKPLPDLVTTAPLSAGNRLVVSYWSMKLLPLLVIVFVVIRSFLSGPRTPESLRGQAFLLSSALACALFYLQASHRIDLNHVQQVFAPVALVAMIGVATAWAGGYRTTAASLLAFLLVGTLTAAVDGRLLDVPGYAPDRIVRVVGGWRMSKADIVRVTSERSPTGGNPAYGIRRARETTSVGDAVLFLPYAAQSYYFADRLFDTPFGWLNPGRFLRPGAEQRFIDAMVDTVFIADVPRFSFDGLAERNMRHYAPRLTRHIYAGYGIFDVATPYVLLSNDPDVLMHRGRYTFTLVRISAEPRFESAAAGTPADAPGVVSTVNTLPPELAAGFRPAPVPWKGGLLLGLRRSRGGPDKDACAALVAQAGSRSYAVADRDGFPAAWSKIGAFDLIDTRNVEPGRYDLIIAPMAGCTNGAGGSASTSTAPHPGRTGVVIEFQEDPVRHASGARTTNAENRVDA